MELEPEGSKSLTDFLEELADNGELLKLFVNDREAAVTNRGLSAEDRDLLLKGKFKEAKEKIRAEGAANAPQRWIVIWVV